MAERVKHVGRNIEQACPNKSQREGERNQGEKRKQVPFAVLSRLWYQAIVVPSSSY